MKENEIVLQSKNESMFLLIFKMADIVLLYSIGYMAFSYFFNLNNDFLLFDIGLAYLWFVLCVSEIMNIYYGG